MATSLSKDQVRSIVMAKTIGAERVQLLLVVEELKEVELQVLKYVTEDDVIAYLRSRLPGAPSAHKAPFTPKERLAKLVAAYGPAVKQQLLRVPLLLQGRRGPLPATECFSGQCVVNVGFHFQPQCLTGPALELLCILAQMDNDFAKPYSLPKWTDAVQLLRLVAAPGMGKSTALDLLWDELRRLVMQYLHILQAEKADKLASRVLNSLTEKQMLVFKMDCQHLDLQEQASLEKKEHDHSLTILAARLMYMVTHDSTSSHSYQAFLQELQTVVPLGELQPMDVLWLVRTAAGLGPNDDALVVFAFDEANSVSLDESSSALPPHKRVTWLQRALIAFVQLRYQASTDESGLRLMPLAVTASTLASATSLKSTSSGHSKVADLRICPLTTQQMWAIIKDVGQRLGQDLSQMDTPGQELPAHVTQVLKFVAGNPRHLAWAICMMSGSVPVDVGQQILSLGKHSPCAWVGDSKAFALMQVLDCLVKIPSSWNAWLSVVGNKVALFNQVLRHGLLGLPVSRAACILPETSQLGSVSWQEAEDAGICLLVNFGMASATAEVGPRSGSHAVDEARIPAYLEQYLPFKDSFPASATVDEQVDQFVWLPPMVAVKAWRDGSLPQVPLICQFMDHWRDREFTDVLLLVVRLQLLNAGGRQDAALSELLPGALPGLYKNARVKLPGSDLHVPASLPSMGQLNDEQFQKCCEQSSYGSHFAYVGPGNKGVDGWVVLQLTNGEPLVVVVQSKKRMRPGRVSTSDVVAEANKCRQVPLRQLMVFVTDDSTDNVEGLSGTRVPVMVIGPDIHRQFYTQAGAFIKRCFAAQCSADMTRELLRP